MAKITFKNNLSKRLKQIADNAKSLDGSAVSYSDLFNDSFMIETTKFKSLSDMLVAANLSIETVTKSDFETEQFNTFIINNTNFDSFDAFKQFAINRYVKNKIFK